MHSFSVKINLGVLLAALLLLTLTAPGVAGNDDPIMAQVQQRLDQDDLEGAVQILKQAISKDPRREELWSKLAEIRWHQADWLSAKDNALRLKLLAEAMEAGRQAIAINEKSLGGHFWTATSIGTKSDIEGVMKNLFRLPELRRHLKIVTDREPHFYYGAPDRYWGTAIIVFPPLARRITGMDMPKALQYIQSALKTAPDFLRNYYLLALWYIEEKDYANAKKTLSAAMARDPNLIPEMAWQNRHYIKLSQELLKELADKK